MNVPTPQKAKVTESIIKNEQTSGRRIVRSANRSTTVKRVSAALSASSAAPLRRKACAVRRRSFDRTHRDDSGMLRRIHKVSSAGNTPTRYIHRQALGPV